MDKVNKYHQVNHNGRRVNRRKRRSKLDLRAGTSRRAPAVQILTISNVPNDVLDAIDQLAAGQDRSRSSFVRRALQQIIAGYEAKAA
ncbi:MAG TPA: ribbon-helix-helix protein, CopG family [Candidatus Udaeobacter sp.]|jgi:hypothetical protein|nr:ribbon-helix-helix protein, CopG family [Candidatus Udaeobacter sp.]